MINLYHNCYTLFRSNLAIVSTVDHVGINILLSFKCDNTRWSFKRIVFHQNGQHRNSNIEDHCVSLCVCQVHFSIFSASFLQESVQTVNSSIFLKRKIQHRWRRVCFSPFLTHRTMCRVSSALTRLMRCQTKLTKVLQRIRQPDFSFGNMSVQWQYVDQESIIDSEEKRISSHLVHLATKG